MIMKNPFNTTFGNIRSIMTTPVAGLICLLLRSSEIVASPVLFPTTGHYYDYSSDVLTWWNAKAAAETKTFSVGGVLYRGYLATLNTQGENDFVWNRVSQSMGWIGASDDGNEGTWRWVTAPGSPVRFWDHGTTITYANWSSGEPNNNTVENYAVFGWNAVHPEDDGGLQFQRWD